MEAEARLAGPTTWIPSINQKSDAISRLRDAIRLAQCLRPGSPGQQKRGIDVTPSQNKATQNGYTSKGAIVVYLGLVRMHILLVCPCRDNIEIVVVWPALRRRGQDHISYVFDTLIGKKRVKNERWLHFYRFSLSDSAVGSFILFGHYSVIRNPRYFIYCTRCSFS